MGVAILVSDDRKLVTLEEAAIAIGRSVSTLRRLISKKEIQYRGERADRSKLVDLDEVQRVMVERRYRIRIYDQPEQRP